MIAKVDREPKLALYLLDALRAQFRTGNFGGASVTGTHDQLRRAQIYVDDCFEAGAETCSRLKPDASIRYASRIRPLAASSLWVLEVEVVIA